MTLLQPGWREATKTVNGVWLHVVEAGQAGKRSLDKHDIKALNAPRTLMVTAANTVAIFCFAIAGAPDFAALSRHARLFADQIVRNAGDQEGQTVL